MAIKDWFSFIKKSDEEKPTEKMPTIVKVVTGVVIGLTLLTFVLSFSVSSDTENSTSVNIWLLIFYVLVTYLIFSYRFWDPIPTDKRGALTFFGKPVQELGSGAYYAPLYIFTALPVDRRVRQKEFPAEPENIYRGDMKTKEELPKGMKPPVRIPFRDNIGADDAKKFFGEEYYEFKLSNNKGEHIETLRFEDHVEIEDDGLAKRVTAEPIVTVRIKVDRATDFFQNIGSLEDAFQQIEDEIFSVISNYFSRMSLAQALQNLRWMSHILFEAVQKRIGEKGEDVKSWGISLQSINIKVINLDHGLNSSISDAAQAPFVKNAKVITAEGEKQKLTLEGQGAARAARDLEREVLFGRGKGFKKIAEEIGVDGESVQAAEVARELSSSENNTVVVGTEGLSQLAGMATALVKSTSNKKSVTTDDSKTEDSNAADDSRTEAYEGDDDD